MILKGYPDYKAPGFNVNAPCPQFGWPNFIIHNKTRSALYPRHTGPLTLKYTLTGKEHFYTSESNYTVNDNNYLILNAGREYSCFIDSEEEVETIAVFFNDLFVKKVLNSLVTSSDKLLEGKKNGTQPVEFFEKLYPHNSLLTPLIMKFRMASVYGHNDKSWLEEQFYLLLKNLLEVHRDIKTQIKKIPSVKLSTRVEIYKKLDRAKSFMDENFHKQILLSEIAKEACLSEYHFIRLFKSLYKHTPHKYIIQKRLEMASHLLRKSKLSVTEVCYEVGFSSPSSFSWLFKQRFGISPEEMKLSYKQFLIKLAILKK